MSGFFSSSDVLHLPVTIGAYQPGDSVYAMVPSTGADQPSEIVNAMVGGSDPSIVGDADFIDISPLLVSMQEFELVLPDGSVEAMPWGDLMSDDEQKSVEEIRMQMWRDKQMRAEFAKRKRERAERERAEGELLVPADDLVYYYGISTEFCKKDDCSNLECTFLHDYHRSMIICHEHGEDFGDDWYSCSSERYPMTVDWNIFTIKNKDLPYFPRRNLIRIPGTTWETDAVHISKFEHFLECSIKTCNKYHRSSEPIPHEFRIPHTDGCYFVKRSYFATLGKTAAGLPATGKPK